MSILARIGDLIAEHDEQEVKFTKCTGCSTCEEITRLRKIIDPDNGKKVRKSKVEQKPKKQTRKYNFTKDELYEYIMQGMNSREIAEKLKVPMMIVAQKISIWFPNYKELKIEAAKKNLELFSKDIFNYEIYQQMKQFNICDDEIAEHYGISRSAVEYRLRKWRNGKRVDELIKNKGPQPSPKERINSLMQENANLEVELHEKEITIQLLQDRIAELEHNHKHLERRSAI